MLGGRFRASFRPLNDAIMQGRIMGVVGVVGCNNPNAKVDGYINELTAELIKHNILVVKTGCAAIASAKEGMLTPEAALERAGAGLREVCEAVGIPPVLHMGSCVGQHPHSGGGYRNRQRGRLRRRSGRRAHGGRRPGMDEREGRRHRVLFCRQLGST